MSSNSAIPLQQLRLGPQDLLEYNAKYRVLICRECRYAIQKNALDGHLRRHSIYREERRKLLAEIASLYLVDTAQVQSPTAGGPPVASLPIIPGHKCIVAGCGRLAASSKRIKRHWSQAHGEGTSIPPLSTFARLAFLQTFFRGTQIHYFEVNTEPVNLETTRTRDDDSYNQHQVRDNLDHRDDSLSPPGNPQTRGCEASTCSLDLETLSYFHHFVNAATAILPGTRDSIPDQAYWQDYAIPQALKNRQLMLGLMAISAMHCASLCKDDAIGQKHREQGESYGSALFIEQAASVGGSDLEPSLQSLIERIKSILRCINWTNFGAYHEGDQSRSLHRVVEVLKEMRGSVDSSASDNLHQNPTTSAETSEQIQETRTGREIRPMPLEIDKIGYAARENMPRQLVEHLLGLPHRMAEVLGRPKSLKDVMTVLHSVDVLVDCCNTSFESNDIEAAVQGASRWLDSVWEDFDRMITDGDPGALLVLSHWVAILVQRAENAGYWIWNGMGSSIGKLSGRALAQQNQAAFALVERIWTG